MFLPTSQITYPIPAFHHPRTITEHYRLLIHTFPHALVSHDPPEPYTIVPNPYQPTLDIPPPPPIPEEESKYTWHIFTITSSDLASNKGTVYRFPFKKPEYVHSVVNLGYGGPHSRLFLAEIPAPAIENLEKACMLCTGRESKEWVLNVIAKLREWKVVTDEVTGERIRETLKEQGGGEPPGDIRRDSPRRLRRRPRRRYDILTEFQLAQEEGSIDEQMFQGNDWQRRPIDRGLRA